METIRLGKSDLQCPPIVFGGNVFGWTLNEKESFKMLDELLENGFTMIDTADAYSHWAKGNSGGESEAIIGKWMKERGVRDKITLATKVGSGMGGDPNISQEYILKEVEESLKRLQTDHIDLYFTHKDDNKTPVNETLSAYKKLIEQGKVRFIGASNLSAQRLKDSLEAAKDSDLPKYEVFQPEYSLMERQKFEGDIEEICNDYHLGVTSYFSLASGFLTGKYRKEADFEGKRKEFVKNYWNAKGKRVLQALDEVAKEHGVSQAGVALGWAISKPGITAPIASATKSSHLDAFKEANALALSKDDINKLDEASEEE